MTFFYYITFEELFDVKSDKNNFVEAQLDAEHKLTIYIHRKKVLGENLAESHAYNPIRDSGQTLGEREKSSRESHQESSRGSLRDSHRDF